MKWTGLTGGIATGKSTARKLIQSLGVPVIDADQIAHNLTEVGNDGYNLILSQFGHTVLNKDNSINRKHLASIIFSQPTEKVKLENILHPLIQQEVQRQKKIFQNEKQEICFYDVPLLFEKKLATQFDTTVLVWCDAQTQLQRLMKRNSLSREEALLRINNQLPLIDKVKLAQHCLDNSSDEEDLAEQVKTLINKLKRSSSI